MSFWARFFISVLIIFRGGFAIAGPLHPAIENSEILREIYLEYLSNTKSPKATELAPDSKYQFDCAVYSIESGQMVQWAMSFKSAQNGRGRFLTIKLEEPGKDRALNYTLLKKGPGWRGESTVPVNTYSISAGELDSKSLSKVRSEFERYNTRGSVRIKRFSTVLPWASTEGQRFETVAIAQNVNDSDEFFIEMGSRSSLLVLDNQGKPMLTGPFDVEFHYDLAAGPQVERSAAYNDVSHLKKVFLPQLFGMKSMPVSHAFSDIAPQGVKSNGDYVRMHSLGVCARQ